MDGQSTAFALVVFIIFIALVFDYVNGFHDAANSIATVVATQRSLARCCGRVGGVFLISSPLPCSGQQLRKPSAAIWSISRRLPKVFGSTFCSPRTSRCDHLESDHMVSRSCRLRARTPSSGAYAGGAFRHLSGNLDLTMSKQCFESRQGWIKTLLIHRVIAADRDDVGLFLMVTVYWIFPPCFSVNKVNQYFRIGQLFSAAAFSLGHGGNDAQKTMGIITIVLVAGGFCK